MNLFEQSIDQHADAICDALQGMPIDEQVKTLNRVRKKLHEAGPFSAEPVDLIQWEDQNKVTGNDYNPNKVAPPEMKLLTHSIEQDGFTQPIVAHDSETGSEIVDGFHRLRCGKEVAHIRDRLHGFLPLTKVKDDSRDRGNRIAATIRHNRARGVHGVLPMVDVVAELARDCDFTDEEIAKHLGMDADEVLRLKQNSGLPELFKDHEYSKAWE